MNLQFNTVNSQFNSKISKIPSYFLPFVFLIVCSWIFSQLYLSYENDFRPQGVHSWAQSDRFSIALNYYDDGLNLLEPKTNYLEYSQGKTGVEFPAIQYISALIAKPFGARSHLFLIYRILCFLCFCLSGLSILLVIKLHRGNAFQQIFIPLFYLASPVLLFYGFNFLPDIPSLAFVLFSYYHFEKFRIKIAYVSIYYAILLGCVAAILKLTSAIFPTAYVVWFILNAYFLEKQITPRQILRVIGVYSIGILIFISISYFFSIRANHIYKSGVFLSRLRYINDWENFKDIGNALLCWHKEYFREGQYWLMAIGIVVSTNPRFRQNGVILFKGIVILGFLCFLFLMGKQLIDHDYYAICTVIPLLLILSLDGIMLLTQGCFGAIALFFIIQHITPLSLKQVTARNQELYQLTCMDINDPKAYMKEAALWLEKVDVHRQSVIFVLYDYPLNTPLVYMDRKGMVINREKMKDKSLVNTWFKINKPDYLVIPILFKDNLANDRNDIFQKSQLAYLGKNVVIYKYP